MASVDATRDHPPSRALPSQAEASLLELAADNSTEVWSPSQKEELILRLYDQLQELELERALLKAQVQPQAQLPAPRDEAIADEVEELRTAERELLEARASYSVRRKVVESVIMTDPTLKAVHSRQHVTHTERVLSSLVNRRDILTLIHENLSSSLASTLDSLSSAEIENIRATKKNQELVQKLLGLTKDMKLQMDDITDPKLKSQLKTLENDIRTRRASWRTMKGIVSAAIVASGVDWARNEELRELVKDEEEDEP